MLLSLTYIFPLLASDNHRDNTLDQILERDDWTAEDIEDISYEELFAKVSQIMAKPLYSENKEAYTLEELDARQALGFDW